MTVEELGQKVKMKYPVYSNLSDTEVGNKTLAKYPVYQSQITEKKKGGLEKFADKIAGPFEAVSNALIKPVVQTFAKPFGETVASSYEAAGKTAPSWTKANRLAGPELLAATKYGLGAQGNKAAEALKSQGYKGAGFTDVVNALSVIPGEGLVAKGATSLSKGLGTAEVGTKFFPKLLQSAKVAAPTGAKFGGAYGLAGALDERKSIKDTALQTGIGAVGGALAGAGLAAGTSVLGLGVKKASQLISKDLRSKAAVQANLEGLTQLEGNNAVLRKTIDAAKQKGIDSKKLLAQTDLLQGAVDKDGTIRTTQEGGAISQLQDFLKPQEDVIGKNLVKENKSIPLEQVKQDLVKAINESGIKGADKVTALAKVENEIKGLSLETDASGNIPLAAIHEAKKYKYANIDYLNPANKNTDKVIAKVLKETVENNTESVDVKNLNKELAAHYAVLSLLEKLDGKKVKGGRLGKYFSKTLGAIVGSHFGPLGAIVGSEVSGALSGRTMSSTFGRTVGKALAPSTAMEQAVLKGQPSAVSVPKVTAPFVKGASAKGLLNLAPKANEEIHALGQSVADSIPGATLAKGPIKSEARMTEKVMKDYGGDYSKMKDTVRNTIIVPKQSDLKAAIEKLPKSEFPVKTQDAKKDPLGYSGFITNHRLSNGLIGEIQVNTPGMIYAKEPESIARGILGDAQYDAIAKKVGVPGGLGHKYYEQWRVLDPASSEAESIAKKAREYHDIIRNSEGYE